MIKPHRVFRRGVRDVADEAGGYLRRRRQLRRPFARVYYRGGRSAAHDAEGETGAALFDAATALIAAARTQPPG